MDIIARTLPETLQRVRRQSRMSQLDLALQLGVSQRHVSFVETGRANPSRALLLAWLQVIDAPLAVQNAALMQAGFAPAYSHFRPDDPKLAGANEALSRLLDLHDPMPALVLDAHWTLLRINRGGLWLAGQLMPALLAAAEPGRPINMLDILCHEDGPLARITNLEECGPAYVAHLRREAATHPALSPKVAAVADWVGRRLKGGGRIALPEQGPPVLTVRYRTAAGELSFFSMFTTFGSPQDITLASLRVEHIFPAEDATAAILRREVGAG